MLKIYIWDDQCAEDEHWEHTVPLDTDKAKIMAAIEVFYPNATAVHIEVEEENE